MNEEPHGPRKTYRSRLAPKIGKKEARKLRARREGRNNPVQAVAVFGLVGWAVAVPTLMALALGIWIDNTWPSRTSWTLMLLLVGIVLGCYNAWKVIQKELDLHHRPGARPAPPPPVEKEGTDDRTTPQ